MNAEGDGFHFVDLLSLRLRARLDCAETRGLLPLMQRLSGLPLPHLLLFPSALVEVCREDLQAQHPWLAGVNPPRGAVTRSGIDWAYFWAWADKVQRRVCGFLGVDARSFLVREIDHSSVAKTIPVFLIVELDPDDEG